MKKTILLIIAICLKLTSFSQENRITYDPARDDQDIAVFMNMMGFDYHKFNMTLEKPGYINVYIDEYLNDSLINDFDHISANKDSIPQAYYGLVFPKLDSTEFTLKIYTFSENDSTERIRFRIDQLGLYKKLNVNKNAFDYSWKLTDFTDNLGPEIKMNKKIPLLYYATAVEQKINEKTITAFCAVPNILNNRELLENKGKITHFFEIGIELVEKIE